MNIWIDNDACAKDIREMILRAAIREAVEVIVVSNAYMHLPSAPTVRSVVVSGRFDAADQHIIDHVQAGDLVITADIPLASAIVAKGARGLSPRGEEYTTASIGERLAVRNLMAELRSGGEIVGRARPYHVLDKKRFADAFDRLLRQCMNAARSAALKPKDD